MQRDDEPFDALLRAVAASPAMPIAPPRVLGDRFVLGERLGEGSFGVVYAADDRRDGKRVAVKLLRQPRADWIYRFKREFRALQGIVHRNLVALDELFCVDGDWYFTMELLAGVDAATYVCAGVALADTLDSDARDPGAPAADFGRLRAVLVQLFDGLSALHAADRVHRDLKPSNLMVTHDGRLVVLDFGLATEAADDDGSASGIVGTPAYMAPEQAVGRRVGPAADLYAAGVMLYELLTGRRPFAGAALEVAMRKQTEAPSPPSAIAPGVPPDLDALCARMLRIDPQARPTAREAREAIAPAPAPARLRADATPFVGRAAELAELRAAFDAATGGGLAACLVCGESGIGKSRLVREFVARLAETRVDVLALSGRCYEREAVPYKAIDGVLDGVARYLGSLRDPAALLPARAQIVAQMFPALRRVVPAGHAIPALDPHELRERAFAALREMFVRIALHRPTVIAIDDLQWADDDGLLALAEILRAPDPPPLVFVGTVRQRAGDQRALSRVTSVLPGTIRVLRLGALDAADARRLAANAAGAGADVDRIASEAGGHPLFVEELARHAKTDPEPKLDDAIWQRVAELDEPSRQLAELVAFVGRPVKPRIVAAAANLPAGVLARAVAELRAAQLVTTHGSQADDPIDAYHDRVREAIVARVDHARHASLHATLAHAYESLADDDCEALAIHWRDAGNPGRAIGHTVKAGDQAARALAFDRAAEWYGNALAMLGDGDGELRRDIQIKLGEAQANAGRGASAAELFRTAAETAPAGQALELRRRSADQLLRSGHVARGIAATDEVLAMIGMHVPRTRVGIVLSLLGYRLRLALRGLGFRARDPNDITADELTRLDTSLMAGHTLAFIEPLRGLWLQTRSLLRALAVGELERVCRALCLELGYLGSYGSRARKRLQRTLDHARTLAADSTGLARACVVAAEGSSCLLNGELVDALAHCDRSIAMLEESAPGLVHERVTMELFSLTTLAELGRYAELRTRQQKALRRANARGDRYGRIVFSTGLPCLRWLVDDRPEEAEAQVALAMRDWPATPVHFEHLYALYARVHAKLYTGDARGAHAAATEIYAKTKWSIYRQIQKARVAAYHYRGLAALAMAERGVERERMVCDAASCAKAIARESPPWTVGIAQMLRAGVALHRARRDDALAMLDSATAAFTASAMAGYAAATSARADRLRGRAGTLDGERYLRGQGVAAPAKWIAMLAPGLDDG
jgi:tetratricopeptide (TPR) repeat protein